MTPGDLYRTCKVSAYRLETLQHYDVPGDEERQRIFHSSGTLPPPRAGKQDDLRLISDLCQAGRRVGRVHVIARPLSDYIRYELAVYPENVEAGEDVRIADADIHTELTDLTRDFAIFDVGTDDPHVILFDYSLNGRLLTYEHSQDPALVDRCRRQYELALNRSVALHEFVAAPPNAR